MTSENIAVTSRAFSRHPELRESLLKVYPNARFNDDGTVLSGSTLIKFLQGCPKAIVSLERIDATILDHLPELKTISKYGVGLDNLDLEALKQREVKLGWRGGVNRRSVSELALTLAINLVRRIPESNAQIRNGQWDPIRGRLLSGKTVGVIGCGAIGKDLIRLLAPFECKFLVFDIQSYPAFYEKHAVRAVDLETLLEKSDVVSIHVPYDASTHQMLNERRLHLMKPQSVLINTARGNIVDESALKVCLINKRISAAALDVYAVEPPVDEELLALPNFFGTTHIGGSAEEAILAMGEAAIVGLEDAVPVDECLARAASEALISH